MQQRSAKAPSASTPYVCLTSISNEQQVTVCFTLPLASTYRNEHMVNAHKCFVVVGYMLNTRTMKRLFCSIIQNTYIPRMLISHIDHPLLKYPLFNINSRLHLLCFCLHYLFVLVRNACLHPRRVVSALSRLGVCVICSTSPRNSLAERILI